MVSKYDELINTGKQLEKEYKFTKAFDVFKEAKEMDASNPKAYISAGEACYLTKQYSESVVLHIIGVMLLSNLPENSGIINSDYDVNAEHIANGLLIEDESLQNQVMEFLNINKEQLNLATDAYKYSLLGSTGKGSYDIFIEILTIDTYHKYQDVMSTIGLHYINNVIKSYNSRDEVISHFTKNINW